jgi:hypothetical protein
MVHLPVPRARLALETLSLKNEMQSPNRLCGASRDPSRHLASRIVGDVGRSPRFAGSVVALVAAMACGACGSSSSSGAAAGVDCVYDGGRWTCPSSVDDGVQCPPGVLHGTACDYAPPPDAGAWCFTCQGNEGISCSCSKSNDEIFEGGVDSPVWECVSSGYGCQ